MPIDIGDISALPHAGQQAIFRLREALETTQAELAEAREFLGSLPPIYSLDEIQNALGPNGSNPLPTAGLLNTTPADTNPPPIPPVDDGIPDYLGIVQSEHAASGIGPSSSDEQVWRFMQNVAAAINASGQNPAGITCGYTLAPPAGSNVFTCAGITTRYNRVTFSNDHTFKILIDSDPGGARTPSWDDNGITPGLYSPATSPGSPC